MKRGIYTRFIKRISDFILAFIILIISSPLMILIIPLLFINNKGSVFFRQIRPGKNNLSFMLIKFKTMNDSRNYEGKLLSDADRLTPLGKFLRAFSLDEFPQLFNVLVGDMSLIGPRPLLTDYLMLYNKHQIRRHEVRPGITGWAQVNGRNTLSWDKRFDLDVWYVDHISFMLDMKILFLTLYKVIRREGINSKNTATMERFTGNLNSNSNL
ncbi:MAG TPA: sugar transferase [Bacteroidales bacterium]|nr:sugar transferase [Bacteroidales bacterium]